jgi:hypothetical protein
MSAFYYQPIPQLATDLVAQGDIRNFGITCGRTELGQQMHNLNIAALICRYPDIEQGAAYEPLSLKSTAQELDIAVFHRLRCFLYQCNEGDVPEHTLYKTLEKLLHSLAYKIASDTTPPFEWSE